MKTGLTACWAADAPGPLLAFSAAATSTTTPTPTEGPRRRYGAEVRVLNADGEGGIPTDFAWSPVDGCRIRKTAMRRAGDMMAAAPHDPSGKDAHWDALSKEMLQYLLKAADLLDGGNIATVGSGRPTRWWPGSRRDPQPARPGLGQALVAMVAHGLSGDARDWSAISSGVARPSPGSTTT